MTVLVYTRNGNPDKGIPECVQCRYTKMHMRARGITFTELDVDLDANANATVAEHAADMGVSPNLPMVVLVDEGGADIDDIWFGFKPEKIKGLVEQ